MKRIVGVVVSFMAVVLIAGNAYSQISSSSYESAMATSKPTAGYKGGFYIQSPDGDFKIKFNPRVETMFYYQSENIADDPSTAENESLDTLSFRLRRAQLGVSATWKDLNAFILIGSGIPGSTYWIANATWTVNPYFSIEWGVEDPQYDLMSVTSSKRFTMVDNPITVTQKDGEQPVWANINNGSTIVRPSFGLPTQIGLFLSGNYFNDRFKWAVSVGNGTESTDTLNLNRQFTYAVRLMGVFIGDDPYGDLTDLAYSETPSFAMGIGGAFEHDDAYRDRNAGTSAPPSWVKMYNWAMSGTADAVFKYRGFAMNLSGMYRNIKVGPGATVEAGEKYLTDFGYLATLGMFVIPKKLELQAYGAQIFREGPDNNVYEFGGGLNYYIRGHNAKFMIDYSRVVDYDDISGTNQRSHNRIRAKMAMYF